MKSLRAIRGALRWAEEMLGNGFVLAAYVLTRAAEGVLGWLARAAGDEPEAW